MLMSYASSAATNQTPGGGLLWSMPRAEIYLTKLVSTKHVILLNLDPDVGVDEDIAHFYFHQLVAGVSFIHYQGVAHRGMLSALPLTDSDIKPENVLVDGDGNLKIADFGLSDLFNYKGKRKSLREACGSPPYVAPEVILCFTNLLNQ